MPSGTRSKPSKYRNVKVVVDGLTFDSKLEAAYWVGLKARQHNGEIVNLEHHVRIPLLTADRWDWDALVVVAYYEADFMFSDVETGQTHVVDAKGVRTAMYKLKKRWLELQDGIVIEEV